MRIIHPRGMAAIVLGALLFVAGTAAQGRADTPLKNLTSINCPLHLGPYIHKLLLN